MAKLGAWEIDVQTNKVFWSDEIWSILEGTPRDIDLDEAMTIYPPAERGRVEALLDHARGKGEAVRFESEIVKFNGVRAWIRVLGEPEMVDGQCVALRGAAQEISDVRALLTASERAEAFLTLAMALADLHVYEIDFVSKTLVKHGAGETFFENGLTYDMVSRDPFSAIHPDDRDSAEAAWAASQAEGVPFRAEYRVRRSDGQEIWAFSSAELTKDADGRPLRLVGALQNITSRKRAEREMQAAGDAAEVANAAKSAFLANMSHEIRTPLNGILAGADMLSRRALDEGAQKLVDMVAASGASLERLLSDILDLARIEAGQIVLETSRFHLGELIRSAAALAKLRADEKSIDLRVTLAPEADVVVEGDPIRTRQVLLNLLTNAVKFTDSGFVAVAAERLAEGPVRIGVQDTGVGFNPTIAEKLFGRFEQADGSITRRFGGSGLGLSISRDLVHMMNGQIAVESREGEGSTFWFTLPLPEAPLGEGLPVHVPASEAAEAVRILLADDHPTNRMVVELMLAGLAEVTAVEDGAQAVAAFSQRGFDVVLMDMQMPVMDGLTAVRTIRNLESERQAEATPIIMLTANALPEHVADSLKAGANLHLQKPVTLASLVGAIASVLPTADGPANFHETGS
jgi:signal transduction histidine kinase/ActR/RegA family two-component response regulator